MKTQSEKLIRLTMDHLAIALDDHPDDATDIDLVDFAINQMFDNVPPMWGKDGEDIYEETLQWADTEAFRATALGLLQTMKACA